MDLSRTAFRFANAEFCERWVLLLLGGVGRVTNGEHKTPTALPLSDPAQICQCIRPREPRQSWSATTIKTLTPNWAPHQSPQTPKIYHSRVNFLLMMAKMKQNRTLTIGRGQILRQNSVRCFACFDTSTVTTLFLGRL